MQKMQKDNSTKKIKNFELSFLDKKYNFILRDKMQTQELLINVSNKDITMSEVNIINQMKMKTRSNFY